MHAALSHDWRKSNIESWSLVKELRVIFFQGWTNNWWSQYLNRYGDTIIIHTHTTIHLWFMCSYNCNYTYANVYAAFLRVRAYICERNSLPSCASKNTIVACAPAVFHHRNRTSTPFAHKYSIASQSIVIKKSVNINLGYFK